MCSTSSTSNVSFFWIGHQKMSFYNPHPMNRAGSYVTLWSVWWPLHFKLNGRCEYRSPRLCILMKHDCNTTWENKMATLNGIRGTPFDPLSTIVIKPQSWCQKQTMLCWNKALWLDFASHMNSLNHLECFISLVPSDFTLNYVYDIDSWVIALMKTEKIYHEPLYVE